MKRIHKIFLCFILVVVISDITTLYAEELEPSTTTEQTTSDAVDEKLKQLESLKSELENMKKEKEKVKQDLSTQAKNLQTEIDKLTAQLDDKNKEAERLQAELAKVQEQLFEVQKMVENPQLSKWLRSKAELLKAYVDPSVLEALESTKNQLSSANYLSTEVVDHLRDNLETKFQNTPVRLYSPLVAGIISYGVLLLPLGLSCWGIFRLSTRISQKQYIMIASLFIAALHIFLFLVSLFMKEDALIYLQRMNENNFIFLQLIIGILYVCYCGLLIVGISCAENRFHLFALLIIFLCYFLLGLYYRENIWRPAMRRETIQSSIWSHFVGSLLTSALFAALALVLRLYKQADRHIALIRDVENGLVTRDSRKGNKIQ